MNHYFQLVASRRSADTFVKVMEAIRMWEFSFLRGQDATEKKDREKAVFLIDERDTIPHFVETDPSDADIWLKYTAADALVDPMQRRRRLAQLRPELGRRIVEVPSNFAIQTNGNGTMVHVSQSVAAQFYKINTGWIRKGVENVKDH